MPQETPDREPSSDAPEAKPQSDSADAPARARERALFAKLLRTPMPFVHDPQPESKPQDGKGSQEGEIR